MKTSSTFQHIVLALSSCAACSIFSSQGRADDALISPPKGFQPALTYQVGDFESINVAYGSISLRFPTATLAPGAAGMRSGFSLFYNSSYFDTRPMPTPSGIVSALTLSKGGGWSHSTTFSPEIVRTDGDCFGNPPQNQGFQMYVVDPDGARHLMVKKLAAGEVAFGVADCAFANYDEPRIYNTAYWDYTQGAGLPYSQTWFSVDGTHMRLAIQSANPAVAGNGYSDYPTRDAWTIYMADGSRVEQTLSDLSSVTTFDKNGNWVKYTKTTVGLQPVETMKDVNLRTVKYTTSSSACGCDEIRQVVTASESTSDLIWRVYWNGSTPNAWTGYLSSTRPQDQGALVYPGLVSKIEFPARSSPDGTSFTPTYSFVYGSTLGQLTSVTLPTSGTVAYAWQSGTPYNLNGLNYPYYYQVLGSRLTTKTVTHDGTSDGWTYTYPNSTGNSWSQVAVKTPSNRTTTYGLAAPIDFRYSMSGYSGRVSTTQEPNGDVRAVSWGEKAPSLPVPYSNSNMPLINPYVSEEYGIFAEGGGAVMEKLRSTDVDVNGIPTSEIEYDWIPYSTATPYPGRGSFTTLRKRVTTPKTTTAYDAASGAVPLDLAQAVEMQDATGVVKSRAEYTYSAVGNLLTELRWDSKKQFPISSLTALSTSNAIQAQNNTYRTDGNLQTTQDPRGNVTTYGYNGTCWDVYPGTIAKPEVGTYTNGYDCYRGLQTSVTNPHSLVRTTNYDGVNRVVSVVEGSSRTTTYSYNELSRWVVKRQPVKTATDGKAVTIVKYDQLGRTKEVRQLETSISNDTTAAATTTGIATTYLYRTTNEDTTLVSNPSGGTGGSAFGWTATLADNEGRVCAVERYSGSAAPTTGTCTSPGSGHVGRSTSSYSIGNLGGGVYRRKLTETDAAGVAKEMRMDSLGRLVEVVEDPAGKNHSTKYDYDLLDNLKAVKQGTLTDRTFSYTSLSRLDSAYNPESGTVTYAYDDAANLLSKVDARTITTCFGNFVNSACTASYDGANRPLRKAFSDGTPAIDYVYSGERLIKAKGGTASIGYGYDELNRVTSRSVAITSGNTYNVGYSYYPAGISRMTYPSSQVLQYDYDDAGRTTSSAIGTTNYATGIQYASHGAMSQMTYGSGLVETRSYTATLQPFSISVSGASSLTLQYSYCSTILISDCGTNNGNVTFQSMGTPTQSYQYDTLNRLKRVDESGGSQQWHQVFSYDQYGNRAVVSDAAVFMPYMTRTPRVSSLTDPLPFAGNRWVDSTVSHDGAGNLSANTGASENFTYDAENRLTQSITNAGTTTYGYDAEGRRARKSMGSAVSYYVYGAEGELVAESGSVTPEPCTRCFLTTDHLGSMRMVTDGSGVKKARLDYAPFGEEITSGFRGGDALFPGGLYPYAAGVGPDQRFTGKERDAETGLDFFEARYLSSAQGRFTSPDPVTGSAHDPQSWNMYAYGRNNPLLYTDPDGQTYRICDTGGHCADDYSDANFDKNLSGTSKDGTVFDKDGNKIGTYQRTSFDDLSSSGNLLFGQMSSRRQASNQFIGTFVVASVVVGTTGGLGANAAGLTASAGLTTVNLQGAAQAAALALPAAGVKVAQMIARSGNTQFIGNPLGFLSFAQDFVVTAVTQGTYVGGDYIAKAGSTIYRVGNDFLTVARDGRILSYVKGANAGGVAAKYTQLGGK